MLVTLQACSLFFDLGEDVPSRASDAQSEAASWSDAGFGKDATAVDAIALTDVAEAQVPDPCPTDLLRGKGSMDNASNWSAFGYGTASAVPDAGRSGAAMRVCSTRVALEVALAPQREFAIETPSGEYYVQGWVKSDSTATATAFGTMFFTGRYDFSTVYREFPFGRTTPPAQYACFAARGTIDGDSGVKRLYPVLSLSLTSLDASVETCALLDDAKVYRVPDGGLPPECRCP
jgi:hypothetical protein